MHICVEASLMLNKNLFFIHIPIVKQCHVKPAFDSKQDWNIPWIGHLQNVCLFCLSEIQNGSITAGYSFNRGSYGKNSKHIPHVILCLICLLVVAILDFRLTKKTKTFLSLSWKNFLIYAASEKVSEIEIQNGSITAGNSFNRGSYGKMESNFSQIL
jgi:hypothetical protein